MQRLCLRNIEYDKMPSIAAPADEKTKKLVIPPQKKLDPIKAVSGRAFYGRAFYVELTTQGAMLRVRAQKKMNVVLQDYVREYHETRT